MLTNEEVDYIINNLGEVKSKYIARMTGLGEPYISDALGGKKNIPPLLAVAIEAITKGKITADWILKTQSNNLINEKIASAKAIIYKNLTEEMNEVNAKLTVLNYLGKEEDHD